MDPCGGSLACLCSGRAELHLAGSDDLAEWRKAYVILDAAVGVAIPSLYGDSTINGIAYGKNFTARVGGLVH